MRLQGGSRGNVPDDDLKFVWEAYESSYLIFSALMPSLYSTEV